MLTIYAQVRERQQEAAVAFGLMFRRWRTANGWTQYTAGRWAEEAGFLPVCSHGGTSELENGKLQHPRATFFEGLGEINVRMATEDYSGVKTRKTLDEIKQSRAILDPDGRPWGPAQFWSCFTGLLAPPEWLARNAEDLAPTLTSEQAAALSVDWAQQAKAMVLNGRSSMAQLAQAPLVAPDQEQERWSMVLHGIHSYTPQELRRLWDVKAAEWLPAEWLTTWMGQLPQRVAEKSGL
jgi:hypothetical protein